MFIITITVIITIITTIMICYYDYYDYYNYYYQSLWFWESGNNSICSHTKKEEKKEENIPTYLSTYIKKCLAF